MATNGYQYGSLTATLYQLVAPTVTGIAGAPMIYIAYWNLTNGGANTVPTFFQFFDSATTSGLTLGSTAPLFSIGIPANGGVIDTAPPLGISFAKGIVVAATTTMTGNTAPTGTSAIQIFLKA